MDHDPATPIIITDGAWMHIRQIRAYHRHYPEIRGEGRSRPEAIAHLANRLARAQDSAPGRGGGEAIAKALADVRAIGRRVPRGRSGISRGHEPEESFR